MGHTVSILGNVNIDLIMGPLHKLPAWGHELLVPQMQTRAAGGAGYTIAALDRLGVSTYAVGAIGDDGWGEFIRREFARCPHADLSGVETIPGVPTGLSVALLNREGERGFVSCSGALDRTDPELVARHEQQLLQARYLLVCGYFFMPALRGEPMREVLRKARRAGVMTMLDTGWDIDDWPEQSRREVLSLLPDVDIFLPNLEEASAVAGPGTAEECAQHLLEHGAGAVALKLGAGGCLWLDAQGSIAQAGRRVAAIDATGAGDSFNAALIYGLEQGWSTARALMFANAFCSIVVSRLRERMPAADEVLALL